MLDLDVARWFKPYGALAKAGVIVNKAGHSKGYALVGRSLTLTLTLTLRAGGLGLASDPCC